MHKTLTKEEIALRIEKIYNVMNENSNSWDAVVIIDRVSQYYFTGTMHVETVVMLTRKPQ